MEELGAKLGFEKGEIKVSIEKDGEQNEVLNGEDKRNDDVPVSEAKEAATKMGKELDRDNKPNLDEAIALTE
ncbi:hypothetical protein V6N13_126087 [Hibiscus sabdariffa]